jgi:1-acyl-sn-glycerol-3-phosphate acyltransferase
MNEEFNRCPTHALTKIEMFGGATGIALRAAGQIPVDRTHYNPAAVRTCLRVPSNGHAVGTSPEGVRRNGELRTIGPGPAYLAMVADAHVVPVTFGTRAPGGARDAVPPSGTGRSLLGPLDGSRPHMPTEEKRP